MAFGGALLFRNRSMKTLYLVTLYLLLGLSLFVLGCDADRPGSSDGDAISPPASTGSPGPEGSGGVGSSGPVGGPGPTGTGMTP